MGERALRGEKVQQQRRSEENVATRGRGGEGKWGKGLGGVGKRMLVDASIAVQRYCEADSR
jgi:hypothetical protein